MTEWWTSGLRQSQVHRETGGCLSCHAQHMTGLAAAAA